MKHILITLIAALATLVHSQPSNGQIGIPVWTANGTSTVWLTRQNNKVIGINGSGELEMVAGGGSSTLGALSDVSLTSLTSGQLLQYNGTGWVNWTPTYAPTNSPTFTGTVTIPSGASIAGYLTSATAASTYAPLASPVFTGTPSIPLGTIFAGNGGTIFGMALMSEESADTLRSTLSLASDGAVTFGSIGAGSITLTGDFDTPGNVVAGQLQGSGLFITALNASELTSGTVGTARLGTGTANSTTYLRGDGTWATVTGGVTSITGTANQITVTGTTTPTLSLPSTITGLTSVTSTTFVGALTGTASGNATTGANTFTGSQTNTTAGAASAPAHLLTGSIYSGGTGTTTFPLSLIQPTGATSSSTWSLSGTIMGINAASGFNGNFFDYKVAGVTKAKMTNSGELTLSNSLIAGQFATTTNGGYIQFGAIGYFQFASDGVFVIYNNAGTGFSRIMLGGTTTSFPAIKRNGTGIDIRLANDSDYAPLATGTHTIGSGFSLQLGNTAVAETPTATHTLIIKDAAGVSYRVLAIPVP